MSNKIPSKRLLKPEQAGEVYEDMCSPDNLGRELLFTLNDGNIVRKSEADSVRVATPDLKIVEAYEDLQDFATAYELAVDQGPDDKDAMYYDFKKRGL
jgi:hypothetical protein